MCGGVHITLVANSTHWAQNTEQVQKDHDYIWESACKSMALKFEIQINASTKPVNVIKIHMIEWALSRNMANNWEDLFQSQWRYDLLSTTAPRKKHFSYSCSQQFLTEFKHWSLSDSYVHYVAVLLEPNLAGSFHPSRPNFNSIGSCSVSPTRMARER